MSDSDVALEGVLDLDRTARLRTDLQQTILETARSLRHLGRGSGPLSPRKQDLQAPQSANTKPTRIKNLSRTPELDALKSRDDPQQHPPAGLSGPYGGLVHLLHRRRRRELLDQRGIGRQESHHAGLHLPRRGTDLQQKLLKVPFVVGGFAAMIYCIDWNNRGYQRFKKAYRLLSDYEKNPDAYPDGPTGRIPRPLLGGLHPQPAQQLPPQPRPLHHHLGRTVRPLRSWTPMWTPTEGLRRLRRPVDESRTAGRLYIRSLRRRQPCGIRVQPEFQILTDENPP